MKKQPVFAAAALLAALVLSPNGALADAGEVRAAVMFFAADRNGDGGVDRQEADALRGAIFDAIDVNGDGRVTREEAGIALVEVKKDADARALEKAAKRRDQIVVKLNLAKPEGIPRDEYVARNGESFSKADGNSDGRLDAKEFSVLAKEFGPLIPG